MKWTIHELIKRSKTDTDLDFTLDLNGYITEEIDDLEKISITEIEGFYDFIKEENLFIFDLNIKTKLTMLCSLSLKEVIVDLDFNTHLNFSTTPVDDDTHLIEGITIDIDQYIFSEILIEKPMKAYDPEALANYKEDIHLMDEEELTSSSPFAKIKQQ
ncbi:MAG: hypothetical protein JEZ05_08310 [Tenericutes bacterium]|nr:hypothetical protein [Mycoplasmatota bacterium]